MEERRQQLRLLVQGLGGFEGLLVKFVVVFRNEIDHVDVLHPVPTLFDRIQLRTVRWKIFEDELAGMMLFEVFLCRKMSGKTIPNNDQLFIVMALEFNQPKDKVFGHDGTVHDREQKVELATARRGDDQAQAGLIATAIGLTQDRRLADFRPSRAANRRERKTAFVNENQECVEFLRFFLIRSQVCSAQRRTSSSECLCDLTTGICGESPSLGSRSRTARADSSTPNSLRI